MDLRRLLSRHNNCKLVSSEMVLGRVVILLFTRDNTSRFVSLKIDSGTADNIFEPRNNLVTEKRNARELLESIESSVSLLKVKFKYSNFESFIKSNSLVKLVNWHFEITSDFNPVSVPMSSCICGSDRLIFTISKVCTNRFKLQR